MPQCPCFVVTPNLPEIPRLSLFVGLSETFETLQFVYLVFDLIRVPPGGAGHYRFRLGMCRKC
jgi:hypothetical protein